MNDHAAPRDDAATRAFSERENAIERSPAQPDDAHRIDAGDDAGPAEATGERPAAGERMTH